MGSRRHLLSADRSLPIDLVEIARKAPSARIDIVLNLARAAHLRERAQPRISWTAIFLRAYGLVAAEHAVLRQSYLNWPLPHVYQHDTSTAILAMQRQHQGRPRLCWGRFRSPESMSLGAIQARIERLQHEPVDQVFRSQLRFSRLPKLIRRLGWWTALNVSGRIRERELGTFSISSLAGQGIVNRDHPSILTSSLSYGPLDAQLNSLVSLIYDHRLFDGMQAARVLQGLGCVLDQQIPSELQAAARHAA